MKLGRRSLLLTGAAIPTAAYGQCVVNAPAVDACRGGVRNAGPAGATLDLNFMFPGSMPTGVTFTRASTATWTDASGVIQTAAVNQPRWDYDPTTHVLKGLLIEGASAPRAQDQCGILAANMAPWFSVVGTWAAEFITTNPTPDSNRILGAAVSAGGGVTPLTIGNNPWPLGQYDGASFFPSTNNVTPNIVQKAAHASSGAGGAAKLCLNGIITTAPFITNGFASLATSGIRFFQTVTGPSADNGSGYIRRVQFWPRVLTDAEMQQVTT